MLAYMSLVATCLIFGFWIFSNEECSFCEHRLLEGSRAIPRMVPYLVALYWRGLHTLSRLQKSRFSCLFLKRCPIARNVSLAPGDSQGCRLSGWASKGKASFHKLFLCFGADRIEAWLCRSAALPFQGVGAKHPGGCAWSVAVFWLAPFYSLASISATPS